MIIINELVYSMFKSRGRNLLVFIKIDIEKTYDQVSRDVIIDIMGHMKFLVVLIQLA